LQPWLRTSRANCRHVLIGQDCLECIIIYKQPSFSLVAGYSALVVYHLYDQPLPVIFYASYAKP